MAPLGSRGRTDWEALGREAILDLLADVFFAPWTEVESRISNKGWKEFRRVQPVQLSGARRKLRASGEIIEETSKHSPAVHGIRLPYPEGRKRELQRLAGRRRKLYRKYLAWAGELRLCGKHAERVLFESLQAASSEAGLYVPPQALGEVRELDGVMISRGPLDAYAHVLELPSVRSDVIAVFESKNINKWIYPNAPELWELLVKAADLALVRPVLPVLVCLRAAWQTGQLAKDIGYLTCQLQNQLFAAETPETEFNQVLDEFDLSVLRHDGPYPPIVGFATRTMRLTPPPSLPEDEDIEWYKRQADRFSRVAPVVLAHSELADPIGDSARRELFAAFTKEVSAVVDWPLIRGW